MVPVFRHCRLRRRWHWRSSVRDCAEKEGQLVAGLFNSSIRPRGDATVFPVLWRPIISFDGLPQFLVAGLPRVTLLLRHFSHRKGGLAADFRQFGQRRQYGACWAIATIDLRKGKTGPHHHFLGYPSRLARHHTQPDSRKNITVVTLSDLEELALIFHGGEWAACGNDGLTVCPFDDLGRMSLRVTRRVTEWQDDGALAIGAHLSYHRLRAQTRPAGHPDDHAGIGIGEHIQQARVCAVSGQRPVADGCLRLHQSLLE